MAKDTLDTLPQHVDDELRRELNDCYTWWRGARNRYDGDIIDWLKGLPRSMDWSADNDNDTYSAKWLAWVYLLNWLTNETRLVVVEAAQRKETARLEKVHAKLERH